MQTFSEAMQKVHDEAQEAIETHLQEAGIKQLPDGQLLGGSGTIKYKIKLDSKGHGKECYKKAAWGVTLHCTAWLVSPDGVLISGKVTSTGGGGGSFKDKTKDEKFKVTIKTKTFGETEVCVEVQATPVPGSGQIEVEVEYSY